ncbi:MAG: hypothetical protein QW336_02320 [Candidatus Anstonellales archaeon]
MDGFIIVDKPTNILSHDLTAKIGRLYNSRAGHSGTLDPNVGGLMIIGLGRYTRLLRFFTRLDKTYVCLAKFRKPVDERVVEELMSKLGKNLQIPPLQSAVAKRPRYRNVYELNILEIFGNRILFRARVESGFYMRVLCEQIGAEMEDLRRIAIGRIYENYAMNTYRLFRSPESARIYSIEELFPYLNMDRLDVDINIYNKIKNGARIDIKLKNYTGMFFENRLVAIMNRESKYEIVLH